MSDQDSGYVPVFFYVIYEDGSIEKITYEGADPAELPVLPKPGRFVAETEYLAALAQLNAVNQGALDALQAAEQQRIRDDYDALRAAGIPDSTARRLTGYTGPAVP